MKKQVRPLLMLFSAAFCLIGSSAMSSDRNIDSGFIVNGALAIEQLPAALSDQAAAMSQVLGEPKVQNKLGEIRRTLNNPIAAVVVTGFFADEAWRGRYREIRISLGTTTQSSDGTDKVVSLGKLEIRTFTDPNLETSVQFTPAR